MESFSKFGKVEKYIAYNGALQIDKNNLYLFGDLVATNLRTHIAINLRGEEHLCVQLNNLEGIQFERYGQHLYLNGQPLLETDKWLVVNKSYGDWTYEDMDYDYGEYLESIRE